MLALMSELRSRSIAAVLLCCVLLFTGTPGQAGAQEAPVISLDEAVALVRAKSGGKVLRAETRSKNQHAVYEIRVLTDDGRVRTYIVDSRTGRVR